MVTALLRILQMATAIVFFLVLMATRSPRRRIQPVEREEPLLREYWRARPAFRAHERLARLKLRRLADRLGERRIFTPATDRSERKAA